MARISAENILFTFVLFALIMVAYGQSIGTANIQSNMNTVFSSWPTFQDTVTALTSPIKNCSAWDWGCQASSDVAHATAFIGAVIAYPSILAASALGRLNAFGNLFGFVLFGTTSSFSAIPFGSLFLLGLIFIAAIEAFRLARGNSTGGL